MLRRNFQKDLLECGCDEAGRGCLAGPVYAAAVILPPDFRIRGLNDSKQLNAQDRYRLRPLIEKKAIAWSIGIASHEEIDLVNILNASFLAMHRAISKLQVEPELLLIDGNRFRRYSNIEHKCIVDGDATYMSIAAASILAKTYRDDYMMELHSRYPGYKWQTNKGYGTPEHRSAITELGLTPFHRKSFRLFDEQYEFEFDGD